MQKLIIKNKYQSPNRMNILTAAGIAQINEPIFPQNGERIFGGLGVVNFNQASQYSDPNNPSDPNAPITPPNCPNCGGGVSQCICVDISEAESVVGIPCCITGRSCETGEPIKIQTNPNNDPEPPLPCEEPQPPSLDDCNNVIFEIRDTGGRRDYFFGTLSENNLQAKCEEFANKHKWFDCPAGLELNAGTSKAISENIICNGETLNVVSTVQADYRCKTADYLQELVYGAIILSPKNDEIAAAIENWKKSAQKTKQYFAKDGKFYNTCDTNGETPSEEPITMCGADGNQYSISPDGTIMLIND